MAIHEQDRQSCRALTAARTQNIHHVHQYCKVHVNAITIITITIRNLYSAIMPLGGYRGAGGTGR